MATHSIMITESDVRAHMQLVWIQTPLRVTTVYLMHPMAVPDDTEVLRVIKTQDVAVWALRNQCGLSFPIRAIFDENGLLCTVLPDTHRLV